MAAVISGHEIKSTVAGHTRWIRISHWILAASVLTLAFSGFVILMAHPRLYWGKTGNDLTPALLELPIGRNYKHGGWAPEATFFPGARPIVSAVRTYDIFNQNGWGRSLHFLAPWLLCQDFLRHLRLPMPPAPGGPPYGLLQKLTYAGVVFVLLPLMVLTG